MMDISNFRQQVVDLLAEEVGFLAELIFDEVLEELSITESDISRDWLGRFIRLLNQKLPEDMDNRVTIIRKISELFNQTFN